MCDESTSPARSGVLSIIQGATATRDDSAMITDINNEDRSFLLLPRLMRGEIEV